MGAMNMSHELHKPTATLEENRNTSLFLFDEEVERAVAASIGRMVEPGTDRRRGGVYIRLLRFFLMLTVLVFARTPGVAADLKPDTLVRWEQYVAEISARNQEQLSKSFLLSDQIPGQTAKLRSGEIVVAPADPHIPLRIPSGLIHDWIGATFIPNATLDEVLPVLRNYDHYKEFYHPNVVESRLIATAESDDRFSMILVNKSAVAKTALDTDYKSTYTRVDDRRWYSVTDATRIQEIAEYDTSAQHMLPENRGTGLIWRLHSITRFEERDGGVYIEVEALALSRDIPLALRWAVEPMVRRVSRSSVVTSLRQTESAVRVNSSASDSNFRTSGRGICTSGSGRHHVDAEILDSRDCIRNY
jgi:hypothetical protein